MTFDPFADLSKLRMTAENVIDAGVRKLLTSVPVGRPGPQEWFQVHSDTSYRDTYGLIADGKSKDFYLVLPTVADELAGEFHVYTLYTYVTRKDIVGIWPARVPGPDDKSNDWWRTAHEAANQAMQGWTRLTANMDLGAYEVRIAPGIKAQPNFPPEPFADLLRVAFRDKVINNADHELVKKLRGLV
jgi:hypothetical protein